MFRVGVVVNKLCGQDGFSDTEVNKAIQVSGLQDFPGSEMHLEISKGKWACAEFPRLL